MKGFKDGLEQITGDLFSGDEAPKISNVLLNNLSGGNFAKLFGIGVGKWLLKIMTGPSSLWAMETLPGCGYRVRVANKKSKDMPKEPNMLSLAFRFVPFPSSLHDQTGLAKSNPVSLPDEAALAMTLLEKLDSLADLDRELQGDPELLQRLIKETEKLLKAARYILENGQYEKWTREQLALVDLG